MKKPKISEKDLQKLVLDYLEVQGVFHYRQNTGAFKTEGGHFVKFGAKGSPDIVAVIQGRYVGIEVKGTNGKQSEAQRAFQGALERAGGRYVLCYTLEDLVRNL